MQRFKNIPENYAEKKNNKFYKIYLPQWSRSLLHGHSVLSPASLLFYSKWFSAFRKMLAYIFFQASKLSEWYRRVLRHRRVLRYIWVGHHSNFRKISKIDLFQNNTIFPMFMHQISPDWHLANRACISSFKLFISPELFLCLTNNFLPSKNIIKGRLHMWKYHEIWRNFFSSYAKKFITKSVVRKFCNKKGYAQKDSRTELKTIHNS